MITPKKVPGWFGRQGRPDSNMAGAAAAGGNMDIFHYKPKGINDKNKFMMYPKAPIEGIKYLQAAKIWGNTQWTIAWRAFKKQVEHRVPMPNSGMMK